METDSKKIGEISIPVPWGTVAAKTWGTDQDPLVLCIHGIMDNAGSFDRLMIHLPDTYYYVCIDLPGHGKSTHFPSHLPVHTINYLLVYRLIHKHFQKKFIILGHSYGGQIGFLFAQVYPECVEKLIMLDTVTLFPVHVKNFASYLSNAVETHIDSQEKMLNKERPTYTREEALERVLKGRRYYPLSTGAGEALLERSVERTEDGRYRFTLDQRIKNVMNPLRDFRNILDVLKLHPVRCPVLIVLGTESSAQQVIFRTVIQYFKSERNIRIKYVEGNHDVHNDNPEKVAPYVKKFLLWQRNKL